MRKRKRDMQYLKKQQRCSTRSVPWWSDLLFLEFPSIRQVWSGRSICLPLVDWKVHFSGFSCLVCSGKRQTKSERSVQSSVARYAIVWPCSLDGNRESAPDSDRHQCITALHGDWFRSWQKNWRYGFKTVLLISSFTILNFGQHPKKEWIEYKIRKNYL